MIDLVSSSLFRSPLIFFLTCSCLISIIYLVPKLSVIFHKYVFDGADLRSPFTITALCLIIVLNIFTILSITIINTPISISSFGEITFMIICLTTVYGRYWGFTSINIYTKKHYYTLLATIIVYISFYYQLLTNSFLYTSANSLDLATKYMVGSYDTLVNDIISFLIITTLTVSVMWFDYQEKRSTRQIVYDGILILIGVLYFVNSILRVVPMSLESTRIAYRLRSILFTINSYLLIIYFHKETQSILRRTDTEMLRASNVLEEFSQLVKSFNEDSELGTFSTFTLRKANNIKTAMKDNRFIQELIFKRYGRKVLNSKLEIYKFVDQIEILEAKYNLFDNINSISFDDVIKKLD